MLTTENSLLLVIDFQARLIPVIQCHEELVRKTAILIGGCRALGVPILAMQQYTKGLGETVPEIKAALGEHEPIEKITFSCYGDAGFKGKLSHACRTNIIISGIEAHICVQQTVLDLRGNGYNVIIAADCIGSRYETDRLYAERRMEKAGAVLTTMESVLFEMLVRADHPKRKGISDLVK